MSKPAYFTTRDIADLIGVEPAFVRGEVADGRLAAAVVVKRPHRRTVYRFVAADVVAWLERYSPATLRQPQVRGALIVTIGRAEATEGAPHE